MSKKLTKTALAFKALVEFSDRVRAEESALAMSDGILTQVSAEGANARSTEAQPSARAAQGEQR